MYKAQDILNTKQAAARLGWSAKWLRVRAQADNIPFRRVGKRKMVFLAKDIAKYAGLPVEEL